VIAPGFSALSALYNVCATFHRQTRQQCSSIK